MKGLNEMIAANRAASVAAEVKARESGNVALADRIANAIAEDDIDTAAEGLPEITPAMRAYTLDRMRAAK